MKASLNRRCFYYVQKGGGMKAKEFFRQVRAEQKEQRILKETISMRHMQLLPQAIRYDKDHVQVSPTDTISESMAWIADQMVKLERLSDRLEARKAQAYEVVSALDRSEERQVMILYYLEITPEGGLRTWDDVANRMGYSVQHVHRIHGEALRNINQIRREF